MIDTLTPQKRSELMSRIHSTDTQPELAVRRMLHGMGYRFRLHGKVNKRICKKGVLPGKPDLVLAKYKTVIFVNGCFWHRHKNCKIASMPKSNVEFWKEKFRKNIARDRKEKKELKAMGWKVITVWECELKAPDKVARRIRRQLTAYEDSTADSLKAAETSTKCDCQ